MSSENLVGILIGGRYEVESYVNAGGMQYVYKAKDNVLQKYVALKTPKVLSAEKRFRRSAVVSAKVNHPNVAKTLDYYEDTAGNPYLIEEFVEGGDLQQSILSRASILDPYLVAKIFHRLSKGLAASHHADVIHRDLKPTNIMVSGGFQIDDIKITDFGIAKMAEDELASAFKHQETITGSQTAMGALPYMSPEAIQTPRSVGKQTDIWSLGAMMYELISGIKPFGSGLAVVHKIIEVEIQELPGLVFNKPQFGALCKDLTDVIKSCLVKNPDERPSADELVVFCSNLCYPTAERVEGLVKSIPYNSYGFIDDDSNDEVFYHPSSVYGESLNTGDSVVFTKHNGAPYDRAHPVIKLKKH